MSRAPTPPSTTTDPRAGGAPPDRRTLGLLAALLALHAALALTALWRTSVTIDEAAHVPAGVSYWQTASFALYHHNPPLVKMLQAIPVLAARPAVDYGGSWAQARAASVPPSHVEFAAEFMRANRERYFDLFRRARVVNVLLSIAGALVIFFWGRDLWGTRGGVLAAALWCLDPNVLAHAGVATTDIGGSVALAAAVLAFVRFLRGPTWRRAGAAGVLFGCAQLAKFSSLALLPILPILALLHHPRRVKDGGAAPRPVRPAVMGGFLVLFAIVALLVVNAGYGFEGTGRTLGGFPFLSTDLTVPRTSGTPRDHPNAFYRALYRERQNRFEDGPLGRIPVPLPEHYVLGLDEQRFESNIGIPGGGYAMYLNGVIRRTGWRTYYLEALALKLPPGTWLLALLAIVGAVLVPGLRAEAKDEAAWLLPAATILLGMSLMTGLDLGVRYVLPMFPFLFVGLGRLGRLLPGVPSGSGAAEGRVARVLPWLVAAAVAWNAVEAVRTWPRYLSYFNVAAGGAAGGHRYLLDSNLDWGQDLLELKRWTDRHPRPEPLALAYFGAVDPAIAGVSYRLPPRDPRVAPPARRVPGEETALRPGVYAISVNFVQGLPHRVAAPDGTVVPADQDAFGYFRILKPAARAGDSIWIYVVDEDDAARVDRFWSSPMRSLSGS